MNKGVYCDILFIALVLFAQDLIAEELEFDFDFLNNAGGSVAIDALSEDVSIFGKTQRLSVFLNGNRLGVRDVFAHEVSGQACLPIAVLKSFKMKDEFINNFYLKEKDCFIVDEVYGSTYLFNSNKQSLRITLPQVSFNRDRSGNQNWDYGDNGLNIHYSANFREFKGEYDYYANTDIRINLGTWRVEADGYTSETESKFNNFVAKRDFHKSGVKVSVGNVFLPSNFVSSFSFNGVVTSTELALSPFSNKSYAPIIQGVAKTNARIELKQSDRTIISEIVPPGPFSFDDYGYVSNGELTLTITEETGEVETKYYPISTLPTLKAIGSHQFTFAAGNAPDIESGAFAYGDITLGQSFGTVSGSALLATDYYNFSGFLSKSFGSFGAIAFGTNMSVVHNYEDKGETKSGFKYSVDYSKSISDNVNLSLVNLGYNDKYYRTFSGAQIDSESSATTKNDFSVNVTYRATKTISLSGSGYKRTQWNGLDQVGGSAGLSWSLNPVNLSLFGNYQESGENDNYSLTLSLSLPLGGYDAPFLTSSISTNGESETYNASMSQSLGEKSSYSLSASTTTQHNNSYYGSLSHDFDKVQTSVSVSNSSAGTGVSASVSGSILKVSDSSLMLSSRRYDSVILVDVGELDGVRFSGGGNGSNGLLASTLSPYSENKRHIDTSSLSNNVSLEQYSYSVNPTNDAMFYYPNNYKVFTPLAIVINSVSDIPVGAEIRSRDGFVARVGVNNLAVAQLNGESGAIEASVYDGDLEICKLDVIEYKTQNRDINVKVVNCEAK